MNRADLVIKSRCIFTGLDDAPFEGAVAIAGNKIMEVGSFQQIAPCVTEKTEILDYGDGLVMAGFIDAHMHYFNGVFQASQYMNRELFDARSEKECVERIKAFGEKHPEYDKLTGMGWFPLLWDEKESMPSKETLDQIEPDRPVYLLSADGHAFWLNSKALEECGITKDSQVSFGSIGKDENGELNGLLFEIEAEETANALAFRLPEKDAESLCMRFNEKLAACGITSTTDMSVNPEPVGDFSEYAMAKRLEDKGKLKLRLNLYPSLGIKPDTAVAKKLRDIYHSDRLRVAGLKQFIDGVSSNYSAYLLEPYSDRPDYTGAPCYPYEVLETCISNANREGFGVRLHAIGDGAIRLGLDIIQKGIEEKLSVRNSLEHLEAIDPADIPRFAALDVTASMQPLHMPPTAYEKKVRLGDERCKYQWPFRSLLDTGAVLAFGTDYPVAPFEPMLSIYDAVARLGEGGEELAINPWEKITLAEALRAYTAGSAYCIGQEDKLGTLEKGKLADIVVLDQNPFAVELSQLPHVKVKLTIVDGEIVYLTTE